MTRTGRIVAASATALLGIAVLAGCSASTSSTPAAPASEAAASAAASPIGGDVLPPVIVEPTATTAEAKVGDTITDFNLAQGDQILLDQAVFGADALSASPSHVSYDSSTGELRYDGTAFATLSTKPTDFTVSGSVFMV